jgi:hypothetical protein
VKPVPFSEWNQHYPKSQQAMHIKALEQLGCGDFRQWLVDERNMFTKIESLPKSTTDGVPKNAPRGIQGGTAHHNIGTGPFCKAFSKMLSTTWSVKNELGPMYTSGATAEDIGEMFRRATEKLEGNLGILEGDFARFDSTIHRLFLELEADIYKYVGCSEQAYAAFLSCIATFGRDKFGTRYSVDGGRHSGDHNTSCGNTLLQALAILFCCAFHDASITGVLLGAREISEKYQLTIPCLGDDNLVIGDRKFIDTVPLKALLLKLGLELEPKKHVTSDAKYLASFCSARFYPVAGGMTVLGPGIGRGIVKSGWYVNPPVGVDLKRLLRADAIGRSNDCSFIPFLNLMWKKNMQMTSDVKLVYTTREMRRASLHNAHVSVRHLPCSETYAMINAVYGLTMEDEEKYASLLSEVKSLPCIVDYIPLARAAVIDGVAKDVNDPLPETENDPIEETPSLDAENYKLVLSRLSDSSSDEDDVPLHIRLRRSAFGLAPPGPKVVPDMSSDSSDSEVELAPFLSPFDN